MALLHYTGPYSRRFLTTTDFSDPQAYKLLMGHPQLRDLFSKTFPGPSVHIISLWQLAL